MSNPGSELAKKRWDKATPEQKAQTVKKLNNARAAKRKRAKKNGR